MKNLLFAAGLLLSSTSAFAMHAYGTDSCVGKSLSGATVAIELSNGTPTSPHRIDLVGSGVKTEDLDQNYFVNIDQGKDSVDEPAATAALVLKVKSETKFSNRKLDDGCFKGSASQSVRKVSVVRINKKLNEFFDLKRGETLVLSCYSAFQIPDDLTCKNWK